MNILLVCDLFPPDKGVSTFRMSFFVDQLKKDHSVDVLKSGQENNFNGQVKTFNTNWFGGILGTILNRKKISKAFSTVLINYDLVIVSAPRYTILEFARLSKSLNIDTIVDIRDLPDLILVEKTIIRAKLKLVWQLINKLQFKYIYSFCKKANAVLAVGSISTSIIQKKLGANSYVINVNNGYLKNDLELLNQEIEYNLVKGTIKIGISGSIHNFRYSNDLIALDKKLRKLDNQNGLKIVINHWGVLKGQAEFLFKDFRNIKYERRGFLSRDNYLKEIQKSDLLILACSDHLIWEPTTSVYDYILLNKPVLFLGLKNNEAYITLENSGIKILDINELENFISNTNDYQSQYKNIEIYSREFGYKKLNKLIKSLANESFNDK